MKKLGYLLALMFCSFSYSSTLPDFPFLTVSGESKRKVAPDMVTVRTHVVAFDKDAAKAVKQFEHSVRKLLVILETNDVDSRNILSYEMDKVTKRAREKNGYNELEILGYELTQRFEIKLTDLKKYSEIATGLKELDNVGSIDSRFDVKNREDISVELIAEAGAKAKQKANQLALGLGVKIKSVFAINDSGSFGSFFATFGLNETTHYKMMKQGELASSMFIPQHIEISKSVNVVYKLED